MPVRLALGPRDLAEGKIEIARRDTRTKEVIALDDSLAQRLSSLLDVIQRSLFQRAKDFRKTHTTQVDSWEDFKAQVEQPIPGFIYAHWDGSAETEAAIKEETKATIRCIPLEAEAEEGVCAYSGKPSKQRVLFAKAY